ncbi:hypothetical protein EF847_15540 [Actinobacteria bacterium YIM 96077]|uniref:Uncharacterized protein n=1 Tax=Phytoactinopolyspora halophila TaxID=1981511 RepID=A0A329QY38_9ACTN|nr:hypothetical protein EF847_15540 [Actinobacteria bacterium YIM 96077]RAW15558.1 hypothetical protein DPM12_07800 [Phytoactinopolyspora halophila]
MLAAAGVAAVALVAWWAAGWLVNLEWTGGADARVPVVVGAPLLGSVLVSAGLEGKDEEFERSLAVRWPVFRSIHVAGAALAIGAPLAVTGLWEPRVYGAFELVRNTLGFLGLVTLAAVVVGARLAWFLPFGFAGVIYIATPQPLTEATAWWTWPVQQWSSGVAAWTAAALFVVGTLAYVVLGSRRAHSR